VCRGSADGGGDGTRVGQKSQILKWVCGIDPGAGGSVAIAR